MSLVQSFLAKPSTKRVLSSKPGEEGFSLIELVVVIAVLAILIVVALPNFQGVTDDAAASAAKKYMADATTECTVNRTRGKSHSVTAPTINGGVFGTTAAISCPTTSGTTQTFTPSDANIPSFTIDLYSGSKTCTLRGTAVSGNYGCTSGKW